MLQLTLDQMQTIDPPPAAPVAHHAAFLVGQDGEGHWLAVETHGHGGGIFVSRDKAVRYARDECRQPDAIRFVDGPIRLFAR